MFTGFNMMNSSVYPFSMYAMSYCYSPNRVCIYEKADKLSDWWNFWGGTCYNVTEIILAL